MEIDPINLAREVTSSAGSNKAETVDATKPQKTADLSLEHTNGRMFEQAVQKANMTHETSAPPEVARYSDSKVDKQARAAIDKPLILNNKSFQEPLHEDVPKAEDEKPNSQEAMLEAFKARRMNTKQFSTLAIDLIILNGNKMDDELSMNFNKDETLNSDAVEMKSETTEEKTPSEISLNTQNSNISFTNKRSQLIRIAGATYCDVIRIEEELGNNLDDTLVRDLNQIAFGQEVAIRLLGAER